MTVALKQRRLGAALHLPRPGGTAALPSLVATYLGIVVALPLAAILWQSTGLGFSGFRSAITAPDALSALDLTVVCSLIVVTINAVTGTVIAWMLVRDSFRGMSAVNAVIDLPFALPTIVAGLTLIALYGPQSPLHVDAAYTRGGIILALLFVTLPFVVRSVQPVLMEADREAEQAAASLGAGNLTIFRRIILPPLVPAILSGVTLAFARSMGEFGSVVLISGNIPFQTQVASVQIYGQIQNNNLPAAAAVSVVLLAISLLMLLAVSGIERWGQRHAG